MPEGEFLQYGGQAIIEGVMMRSPKHFAVACRAPNQEIVLRCEPLEKSWISRQAWLKKPFLRGSLALIDAMMLGIRAMKFAAAVQLDPQYEPRKLNGESASTEGTGTDLTDEALTSTPKSGNRVQDFAIGGTIVFSFVFGIGLFVYLPNLIAQFGQAFGWTGTTINFVAGLIKIVIFFGYIWLIGKHKEIEEVFRYHGAEHKAINTLEAEEELNLENCMRQTRLHPRCGTSFAIVVLLLTVLIFTFIPRYLFGADASIWLNTTVRLGVELMILPLIAGMAYEIIRLAGKHKDSPLTKLLLWPGLMSQYLTTREPEPKHVEVALAALQAVVDAESPVLKSTAQDEPFAQIA